MTNASKALRTRADFRRLAIPLLALVVAFTPSVIGAASASEGVFRDNFDVFTKIMTTPIGLIIPILVVLLTCVGFTQEIENRFIANTRSRTDIRSYVLKQLRTATLVSFLTFFSMAAVAYIVAFVLWPAWGNPHIDPSVYEMTESDALADSFLRTSYSSFLVLGSFAYGLIYSCWLGVGAATYAAVGVASVVLISNRILALATPFLIFFAQTILASLLDLPQLSLLYSLLPFGLNQFPILEAASPTLALMLVASLAWAFIYRRMITLPRLS